MKNLILLIFTILIANYSYSSHAAGGYINYTCLGNNTYEVKLEFIRDCSGATPIPNVDLHYETGSTSLIGSISLIECNTIQYCTEINANCGAEQFPTFQKCTYNGIITLPNNSSNWLLYVEIDARNNYDYVNDNGTFLRLEAGINNLSGNCNSSAIPTGDGVIQGCLSQNNIEFNSGYFDVNNDNITVSQTELLGTNGIIVYYLPGATDQFTPYPVTGTYNFNNGNISFSTNTTGTSSQSMLIEEYDQNGVLSGWYKREVPIIITNSCIVNPPTIFFTDNGTSTLNINGAGQTCFNVTVLYNNGSTINDVSVNGLLDGAVTNRTPALPFGEVVEVCFTAEANCTPENLPFEIEVDMTSNCIPDFTQSVPLELNKDGSSYCPQYQYVTNINPQSGNVLLSHYKAQDKIWVGDDMPTSYDINTQGPEGVVIADQDVIFEAGLEVVLPSCQPSSACVDIVGNVTLRINPLDCLEECPGSDILVCSEEIFGCRSEKIMVEINGGTPPFDLSLFLNNQLINQVTTGNNYVSGTPIALAINNEINQYYGYQDYKVIINNALGESATINGQVLGTKRFYEPLTNNMLPNMFGDLKYAVSHSPVPDLPAVVYDDVNSSPPYYGATWMNLYLVNQYGNTSLDLTVDLQNTGRWSIDNGEIHFTGHRENNPNLPCLGGGSNGGIHHAKLEARNCFNAGVYEDFFEDLQEPNTQQGYFYIFGPGACYDGPVPWAPVTGTFGNGDPFDRSYYEVDNSLPFCTNFNINDQGGSSNSSLIVTNQKSFTDANYKNTTNNIERRAGSNNNNSSQNLNEVVFSVYPSPFTNNVKIDGDISKIENIDLSSINGATIRSYKGRSNLDLEYLDPGTYLVRLTLINGEVKIFKVVKI